MQRRYCPPPARCQERAAERRAYRRKRERETGVPFGRVTKGVSLDGRASARRGRVFERLRADGWLARIASGDVAVSDVVAETGESQANVSRSLAAFLEDEVQRARSEGWERAPEVVALLEPTVDAFAAFRAEFFRDERGRPYLTPLVHRKWIEAILGALQHGRRLVILSPPRHGKTQLLVHFVIWLICRNPNVRLMWVGGNEDIAVAAVGAVRDELENNEKLIRAIVGPGRSFKPGRGKWSSSQLTVANRTITGIKSDTLVAIGKGGQLLSRDADGIVFDDIVDHKSTRLPGQRSSDLEWAATQLGSRKEEHTGIIGIGSRQHHDDLWGHLVENPVWESLVEQAHDPDCELPMHGPLPAAEHQTCDICAAHVDCLLFPEIRSMRWLQDQRAAMNNETLFEMVYQNVTRPEGAEYITVEHLRACRNPIRRIGELPELTEETADGRRVPRDIRLCGGLDPAESGQQGVVLWALDVRSRKRYLIDLEIQRGGAIPGARDVIGRWYERYGLKNWVVESIGFQKRYLQDREILDFTSSHGVSVVGHITHAYNKMDAYFGLPAQFELFKCDPPLIDLPYGDEQSRAKVQLYENQLLRFEPGSRKPSDLLMAGWFPEGSFRRWVRDWDSGINTDYDQTGYLGSELGDVYTGISA